MRMACLTKGAAVTMAAVLVAGMAPGIAGAQSAPTEVSRLGGAEVTRHMHNFLDAEERAFLEVITSAPEALEVLLGGAPDGHAAMAVAPGEGLIRDGMPVDSAHAVAGLGNAAAARAAAQEGCDAARQSGPACVVVLEVAPGN